MTEQSLIEDATAVLFTCWDHAVRPLGYTGPAWHEVSGEMRVAHLTTVRSFLAWLGENYLPLVAQPAPPVRTSNARLGRSREEEQALRQQWEEEARRLLAIRRYSHRYLQRLLGEATGVNPSLTVVSGLIAKCGPITEQIGA